MPTHALNTEDLEQSIQVLRDLIQREPARESNSMAPCLLITGEVMTAPALREELVQRMAADLVKAGASPCDRSDCIRVLFWTEAYHAVDIAMLVDDARQVAFQIVVVGPVMGDRT